MLPYAFSAMTMKSVGVAAKKMVQEIRKQIRAKKESNSIFKFKLDPNSQLDSNQCVSIATDAALNEMVAPGLLVLLTPLTVGFLFGPKAVAGVLAGSLISGVQMAISASNSGGAWDNAKKYIECNITIYFYII